MPIKFIGNPSQAYTNGATWANGANDNSFNTQFGELLNASGVTLYVGDIISLDVTGTQAILPTATNDIGMIGVVGSPTAFDLPSTGTPSSIATTAGGNQPAVAAAFRSDTATLTNGSATVADTSAVVGDMGKTLILPLSSGNQYVTVTTVTAGTGFTISANYTGTTGSYTISVLMSPSTVGPGWVPNSYVPGAIVPIVTQGFCRVNITSLGGVTAKSGILTGTSGSPVATYTATGSVTAAQAIGVNIIPLEAYAARDLSLTNLGISGHETIRAVIT